MQRTALLAPLLALVVASAAAQRSCSPLCSEDAVCVGLGPGCAPAGMCVPDIHSTKLLEVGTKARIVIDSPSTPHGITLFSIGFSSTFAPELGVPLPFDLAPLGFSGCSLYSGGEAAVVGFALNGNGTHKYRLRVPEREKYCGSLLTFQALILGPNTTSSTVELLASNGLGCTAGN